MVINIDQNRKHAACATQVERQVGKKAHTHDTDSWKQANTQGRCVRETQAIIGKCQGWGFTLHTPTWRRPCQCTLRGILLFLSEYTGTVYAKLVYGV